ncbi:MAG TPA: T9SS type A sorting domain-containing protein [Chitinophagales bacterium]|nr:T9SS type A sorting domain-containing protein [Chitinophagales bacterium]
MKKISVSLIFALNLFLVNQLAWAGGCPSCTPAVDPGCTSLLGTVCTDPAPAATAGTPYSASINFQLSPGIDTSILGFQLSIPTLVAEIDTVTGLPDGLTWECGNDSCLYHPNDSVLSSQYGCLRICGTPCGPSDTLTISMVVSYTLSVPPIIPGLPPTVTLPNTMTFTMVLVSTTPDLEISSASDFLCPSPPGNTLDLTATAGFVSYLWSDSSTGTMITVSSAGTYSVTATDNLGCLQTESKEIQVLGAVVSSDTTICANTITQLTAEGGDNFAWSPSANLSSPSEQNPVIIGIQNTTTYTVTVSNNDCSSTASVTVTVDNAGCSSTCGSCTASTTGCSGNQPSPCGTLPDIQAGVNYDESLTFYFPQTVALASVLPFPLPIQLPGVPEFVNIKSVIITSIDNLPPGFEWECDQLGNDCRYFPALYPSVTQYGCVRFCGNTCGNGGPETIDLNMATVIDLDLPQNIINLIDSVAGGFDGTVDYDIAFTVNVTFTGDLEITPPGPITITQGQSVTLTATSGFTGYTWSNGATGSSITVNTSGTYTVQANDGTCDQTASVQVTVVTGIDDVDVMESTLSIYPNPTSGSCEIAFELLNASELTVEMFSLEGQRVLSVKKGGSFGRNTYTLDLHALPKGAYFIKVSTEYGSVNRRIALY